MSNLNSVINVQVDSYDKDVANKILKQLGLNMSTYINMAIKQLINKDGIPFEVVNPKPNKELLSAIKEGDDIIQEIKEGKRSGYTNIDELFSSLDD
jgi:DNA-damage-inducible protein J